MARGVIERPRARPAPQIETPPLLPRPFRVQGVERETADTWTLTLVSADGKAAPAFLPGQFAMLYAFGVGEVPISLSGDPDRPGELSHTVRAVGSVTRALAAARPGDLLGLRGPYGTAWPLEEAEGQDVVVVAGGIGLAPLRPAILRLLARRERFGRVHVLYGARSPAELLFVKDLERWRARLDAEVRITVDRGDESWRGPEGVVTTLFRHLHPEPERTVALVCGPEVMMRFAAPGLVELGLEPARVHLSLERNMSCGVGLCGHCRFGPFLVCRDGPVFSLEQVGGMLGVREL
ncbi:FAD/NAD(P)-binding protein [Limnochorda pilosa]|uniref:Oxidoreductase n=1 Tax=Limnochorda pilosa TaxID=1555112 RepID=A0A0K2SH46_LIMPI|nr:FAD/NAD(P)-binding protein [Limnochorda pilosa]BAS26441.1 oxidoreductase [Limnochorda pilosa]